MRILNEAKNYENAVDIDFNNIEFFDIPNYASIPGCDPKAGVIKYKNKNCRVCARLILFHRDNDSLYVCITENNRLYIELPGGGLDEGETPTQAAARELREETGISIPEESIKYSFKNYYYELGDSFFRKNNTGVDPQDWWTGSYNYLLYAEYIGNLPNTKGVENYTWISAEDLIADLRCKPQWKTVIRQFRQNKEMVADNQTNKEIVDDSQTTNQTDSVTDTSPSELSANPEVSDDSPDDSDLESQILQQTATNAQNANKNIVSDIFLANYVSSPAHLIDNMKNHHIKLAARDKDKNDPEPHVCFTRALFNPQTALSMKWAYGMIVSRKSVEEQYPLIPYNDFYKRITSGVGTSTDIRFWYIQEKSNGTWAIRFNKFQERTGLPAWLGEEIYNAAVELNKRGKVFEKARFWSDKISNSKLKTGLRIACFGPYKNCSGTGPELALVGFEKGRDDVLVLSRKAVKYLANNQLEEYEERVYPPKGNYLENLDIAKIILPAAPLHRSSGDFYQYNLKSMWNEGIFSADAGNYLWGYYNNFEVSDYVEMRGVTDDEYRWFTEIYAKVIEWGWDPHGENVVFYDPD